jgi:hypothetical protein
MLEKEAPKTVFLPLSEELNPPQTNISPHLMLEVRILSHNIYVSRMILTITKCFDIRNFDELLLIMEVRCLLCEVQPEYLHIL